jgi:hypothetical protein
MASVAIDDGVERVREYTAGLQRRMETMRKAICTCGRTASLSNPAVLHAPPCAAYLWANAIRLVSLELEDFEERQNNC